MRRLASCTVLSVGLFATAEASAQTAPGFSINRFDPSERGSEWFVADSLRLDAPRPTVGVVFEGQYRPLAVYDPAGQLRAEVVRHVLTLHPGASVTLAKRVRLGFDLPVVLFQDGDTATVGGVTYAPGSSAVGDLRLGADVRIVGEHGKPFQLALGARVYFPTGSRTNWTGDGTPRGEPHVTVAGDIGPFVYSARFGVMVRGLSGSFADGKIGTELDFAAAAGLRALDRRLVVGPEVFGSTVVSESNAPFSLRSTPVEALLGAHYTLPTAAGDFRFGAGIGAGLTRGFGAPVVRYLANLEWSPGAEASDRDKDGVADAEDACPDTFGVAARGGCPEEAAPPPPVERADRDKDGVVDDEDRCPDVAGARTSDPQTNGCPPDKDVDGVYDAVDACPDVKGVATNDPKTNGCPPDKDGDGVTDSVDACPDVKGAPSSDTRFNGCPPDKDGDGVANEVDACPDEPGKADPDPSRNGCPKAFVSGGVIKILDQVKFKTASSEILPGKDSEEVLRAVQKVLADHPEIKKVRVEGHTDNQGPADYNRRLSAARAQSVVAWLAAHGVDKARLESAGFGPDKPVDKNDTEAGRRNNRRVEFHIEEGK